ncbi:HEAT repeat domain-containing protein [Larkinella humicola]|uniref:HEAT repeat domain-containing protein n=1 Tax=Larkinella humicola TaxID=2607654 RepID=A0A5N1J5I6_9BACT|nr:HEAT repeat domain-containing protein [Larkinella humicola]KAA9345463.1 HEAT repeat domain-containing protein [Larkinella humicola]
MNCESAKEQLIDLLSHQLPATERAAVEVHLAHCPECQTELAATRQLWLAMGNIPVPEPGEKVRSRFYAMLETVQIEEAKKRRRSWKSILRRVRRFLTPELVLRVAYSLSLVLVGVAGGYWLNAKKTPVYEQQINDLGAQVQQMRQTVLLSLLENASATERLRAVEYTKDIKQVDAQVVEALLSTLNNDSNVNVRLVTLEALAQLAADPKVREGLVHSIVQQDSPLVQSALADVMVKLQEKRSLKPLRQLLRQENLNDFVKVKIEQTIKDLT